MGNALNKVARYILPVISIGVTIATNYFADKELDEKIAKKTNEAISNLKKELRV